MTFSERPRLGSDAAVGKPLLSRHSSATLGGNSSGAIPGTEELLKLVIGIRGPFQLCDKLQVHNSCLFGKKKKSGKQSRANERTLFRTSFPL